MSNESKTSHHTELYEERIRIEQLRLLLSNLGSSAVPGILVSILMVCTLQDAHNQMKLIWWCAIVSLSKVVDVYDAHRILKANMASQLSGPLTKRLMLLHAFDGVAWGGLAWITLGSTTPTGSILVIAVLSGIVGNSMSLLSPVLPVFAAFCICELGMLAWTAWQLHDVAYTALAIAALLYLSTLLPQARNSARIIRTGIKLRFNNIELIQQLQIESEKAKKALYEAEQANLAKSKFLAAASHDLRQPIHAQGLFLEVLSRTELTASQIDLLKSARDATDATTDMLHTLLDYSRIESGAVEPQIRSFLLQPLLNKIENEWAAEANAKNIVYRSRETYLAVQSDPALLELILRNLVSNAIRYTHNGGILLGCRRHGNFVDIEVWDTGIGIEIAEQIEIFREFYQLGNPERDRQKGLGLGLAIVKGLSDLLRHEVFLASRLHKGTVFRLRLPISTMDVVVASPMHHPKIVRRLIGRILVIDDDENVRKGMIQLLTNWGCQCYAADSLDAALILARIQRPNVIISDYRLREQRTGSEAIQAIRVELGCQVPALFITGDTAPVRLSEARTSGLDLLHKPVSPNQLYSWLANQLIESD